MAIKKTSPAPSARQAEFLRFCSRALGSSRLHPLHKADAGFVPGATIAALVDAFKETDPRPPDPPAVARETYEGPQWREPFTVYGIRNTVTGSTYIGRAKDGFLKRYHGARWWEDHHNKRLVRDVELYGVLAFRVSLWVATDERDMIRLEGELIRGHRLTTYNEKVEPDAVQQG